MTRDSEGGVNRGSIGCDLSDYAPRKRGEGEGTAALSREGSSEGRGGGI